MKKITFLFALLCASVMGFATDWTGQVVGHVTNVWLDGIGSNENRTEFDYAVNYLTEYDNGTLTITIDYATENFDKIVGLVPKIIVNGAYAGDFSAKQWSSSTYQAGATLSIYFQFDYNGGGNGSSQFQYTIPSGGSTPDPVLHVYCDSEIGHEASPTAAAASFVLLSISSDGEGHTTVTIKQDAEKNSEMFDYLQVTNYAATGSDVTEGGSNKMEVTFNTPTADVNGEITLEILWSTVNWGGRWMVQNLKASASATCAAPAGDEEKPSMADASVSVDSKTHNSVVLAISGAKDNVGVTQYVVKNHSDDSSVGEYAPAENKITISGLSPETAYNWDVYAKDAAGNVSDNCKNITFTTDALASNYCGETLINGDKSIALTCELVSGIYRIIVEGTNLNGFGGSFYNPGAVNLNTKITSSTSTRIVCELDAEPSFYTPLYVNMPGEVSFSWPNDVIWGSCPAVAVTGVSLNLDELEMQVGGATQTLVATIAPSNATNQNVTWSSNHPEVASVINGVVTAEGEGTARITVTTEDGGFTDYCDVTVTVPAVSKTEYKDYATTDVKNIFILYSVTRNVDQTLTFKLDEFEHLPALFGFVAPEVWVGNSKLGNMTLENGKYTFTTADTYTPDDELSCKFHFVYGGGGDKYITFSYIVGSEQAAPASVPVGSVVLNKESNTLSVGETDNLTATVYPTFATDASSITWDSSAEGVATVGNGTVTAVAAGTANITATCGGVTSAPYVVTVTASLTEAKFYGCGAFANNAGKVVAYDYVFTRATNHKVTLDVVFSRSMSGIVRSGNFMIYINGVNQHMTYTEATHTATYDFGAQAEDASIYYYFYFPLDGGGLHQIPQTAYVVGSSNDAVHAFAIGEKEDNIAALTDADGQTFNKVFVNRSFTAGSLYTLVLPFNADATLTAEKFPGQLTKLNNTIVKENGDLKVNFVDVDAIEAGVPYLYVPSANVANPVFENVTISKDLNPTEPADGKAKYYGIYAPTTGVALKAIDNAYVLGSDKYLYNADGLNDEQQMKALRGYFVLNFPAAAPGAPKRMAQVIFNGNETQTPTDIENIQTSDDKVQKLMQNGQLFIIRDGKMYNAQGQLVK